MGQNRRRRRRKSHSSKTPLDAGPPSAALPPPLDGDSSAALLPPLDGDSTAALPGDSSAALPGDSSAASPSSIPGQPSGSNKRKKSSSSSESPGSESEEDKEEKAREIVRDILRELPDVAKRLQGILSSIDKGEGIHGIDTIPNKTLLKQLKELFQYLKLEKRENGAYYLPDNGVATLHIVGSLFPVRDAKLEASSANEAERFEERGAIDKNIKLKEMKQSEIDPETTHQTSEYRRSQALRILGSRSATDAQPWVCDCKAINIPEHKLIFATPKFQCSGCSRKYLDKHDLIYCLADVRVNAELLLSKFFEQIGPECMANAMCQVMLMMHTLECIVKDVEVNQAMKNINPFTLVRDHDNEYPSVEVDKLGLGVAVRKLPGSIHKFIKMALRLKKIGIRLEDGTRHRIGDISFLHPEDHESICTELANGVPLLAIVAPGINFHKLGYCQVYRPPLLDNFRKCNEHHKVNRHDLAHEAHMVVLLGPAFKGNDRAYWFANSQGMWCERAVVDDVHESAPDIEKAVEWGVGKVEEMGLLYSVVKLWPFGEIADPGSVTLEDEDEEPTDKYKNKESNRMKFMGAF